MSRKRNKRRYTVDVGADSIVGIRVNICPVPPNLAAIKEAIKEIDGVHLVSNLPANPFTVYVANELFDECVIARQIEDCVQRLTTGRKKTASCEQSEVHVQATIKNDGLLSNYYTIQTDYRHTDEALLKQLTSGCSSFNAAWFDHGGYNIRIRVPEGKCFDQERLLSKVQKVIDAFYDCPEDPPEPFKAERTSKGEVIDAFLVVATNYRFNKRQQKELEERFETEVPGVYNAHFEHGGYNAHFIMANDFFDRDEAAAAVIGILKEYVASIGC